MLRFFFQTNLIIVFCVFVSIPNFEVFRSNIDTSPALCKRTRQRKSVGRGLVYGSKGRIPEIIGKTANKKLFLYEKFNQSLERWCMDQRDESPRCSDFIFFFQTNLILRFWAGGIDTCPALCERTRQRSAVWTVDESIFVHLPNSFFFPSFSPIYIEPTILSLSHVIFSFIYLVEILSCNKKKIKLFYYLWF